MRSVRLALAGVLGASLFTTVTMTSGVAAQAASNSSALDPTLAGEVLDLLSDLAHWGTTVLIATHEMNLARDVANEVAYLDSGVLVEQVSPERIFDHPKHQSTHNFLERVR